MLTHLLVKTSMIINCYDLSPSFFSNHMLETATAAIPIKHGKIYAY